MEIYGFCRDVPEGENFFLNSNVFLLSSFNENFMQHSLPSQPTFGWAIYKRFVVCFCMTGDYHDLSRSIFRCSGALSVDKHDAVTTQVNCLNKGTFRDTAQNKLRSQRIKGVKFKENCEIFILCVLCSERPFVSCQWLIMISVRGWLLILCWLEKFSGGRKADCNAEECKFRRCGTWEREKLKRLGLDRWRGSRVAGVVGMLGSSLFDEIDNANFVCYLKECFNAFKVEKLI